MDENLLRDFLREWIAEKYSVTAIEQFEDESDSSGLLISHREIYRRRCESLLADLKRVESHKLVLEKLEAELKTLSAITPDEKLFHWFARGESRDYSGVCYAGGIISFFDVPSEKRG